MTPVVDPFNSHVVLCPCGLVYENEPDAARCARRHRPPVIPGAPMRHRPSYVPADSRYVPGPRTYRRRGATRAVRILLAVIVAAAVVALAVLIGTAYAGAHPRPAGPVVTPTTYGAPGPTGGPR